MMNDEIDVRYDIFKRLMYNEIDIIDICKRLMNNEIDIIDICERLMDDK